jgi:hypothetical protein
MRFSTIVAVWYERGEGGVPDTGNSENTGTSDSAKQTVIQMFEHVKLSYNERYRFQVQKCRSNGIFLQCLRRLVICFARMGLLYDDIEVAERFRRIQVFANEDRNLNIFGNLKFLLFIRIVPTNENTLQVQGIYIVEQNRFCVSIGRSTE